MRVNVEKVLERDQKLSEMDRRADELQVSNLFYVIYSLLDPGNWGHPLGH